MTARRTTTILTAAILTAACSAAPSTPTPATSATPSPEQQLLAQAHTEQWPAPDDLVERLARLQCPEPGHAPTSTDLAVNTVILDTKLSKKQAQSFVYTARRLFCPDAVGQ